MMMVFSGMCCNGGGGGLCSVLNCYVSSQFTEEKFRQFIACCNVTIIAKSCSYPEQIVAKYFIVLLNSPFESRVSFRGKKNISITLHKEDYQRSYARSHLILPFDYPEPVVYFIRSEIVCRLLQLLVYCCCWCTRTTGGKKSVFFFWGGTRRMNRNHFFWWPGKWRSISWWKEMLCISLVGLTEICFNEKCKGIYSEVVHSGRSTGVCTNR